MVPRLSAPTITYALSTPGRGFETCLAINDSHCPLMEETSNLVRFTTSSMSEDFPSVPMIMTEGCLAAELVELVTLAMVGLTPVTR